MHACVVHGIGVPHIPSGSHPCTPLPEHSFAPLLHGPEHWPAVQALLGHATAVSHCPLAPHVSTPLPEHCVAPGVQTPEQAPATHP